MRYRVTALTPLLVGDGHRLSPIDYMVWKDHVNVLDQTRIFKLLAKGPRLEGYLTQLKRADKLDFASWGGFAQNFADRRIPFEHPSCSKYWDRATGESVHIPTFSSGLHGPYLPGSALKGALRTGVLYASVRDGSLKPVLERFEGDRPPRHPAEALEDDVLGRAGNSRMRFVRTGDSKPVDRSMMKVYLLRLSTVVSQKGPAWTLGWKQSPRGAVDSRRVEDSTPWFAEMAAPGSTFEGDWQERSSNSRAKIFQGVNQYAAAVLAMHRQYGEATGLTAVAEAAGRLAERVAGLPSEQACLLPLGWGGGLFSKTAWVEKDSADYRAILGKLPFYSRAVSSGLPFPKTRRIVFEGDRPSTIPGWVLLEVA